jgi:spore coat polysaccharide biosynthesis protein SpsF
MQQAFVCILIQARSGSTRLPGKIFAPLPAPDGPALLAHVLRRLDFRAAGIPTALVIPEGDAALGEWCERAGALYFTGPEEDVRERYRRAARALGARYVVRATGDNPCVDRSAAQATIDALQRTEADLFSFSGLPLGAAVEAMRAEALLDDSIPALPEHCEHVTLHIKHHPERFKTLHETYPALRGCASATLRVTVDQAEDLRVVDSLFRRLGPDFDSAALMELFEREPELFAANQHVEQRVFRAPDPT